MTQPKKLPSREYLIECFNYDSSTGKVTWNYRPEKHFKNIGICNRWNSQFAGKLALNTLDKYGYRVGGLDGKILKSHRVIYKIVTGDEPGIIDHVCGDIENNTIHAMENGSYLNNSKNRKLPKNNNSGVIGVGWNKRSNKWIARIGQEYEIKFLGYFDRIEDAIMARELAEKNLGYHDNHGRKI
ncbi:AP2 domain protein [compost metagenome]